MKRLLMIAAATILHFSVAPIPARAATVVTSIATDQGAAWTPAERAAYYSQDQGSRIMPLRWMKALKQANGDAFLADGLARYGYLTNTATAGAALPVGFTTSGPAGWMRSG